MFTRPDKGVGQNDIQSILFSSDLDVLLAGIGGIDCVVSGCVPTAQGSPDMTVAIAAGSVRSNGITRAYAGGNATIGAADATNPRIDFVVIVAAGTLATRAGTAAAAPKPPTRTANDVVLAAVFVPANDTTISTDQITDMRVMQPYHDGVAKAWCSVSGDGATLRSPSYNIASKTDTGTGDLAITLTTSFSSALWVALSTIERASSTLTVANDRKTSIKESTRAAGSVSLRCLDSTATTNLVKDPNEYNFVGFGQQ
jgi:hypothetical protein